MMKHLKSKSLRSKNVDVTFRSVGLDCTKRQAKTMIGCDIKFKSDHLKKIDLIRIRKLLDEVIKSSV